MSFLPIRLSSNSLRAITATLLLTYSVNLLSADSPQLLRQSSTRPFPLEFESNVGQVAPEVRFLARAPGFRVFLLQTKVVLSLHPDNVNLGAHKQVARPQAHTPAGATNVELPRALTLQFLKANSSTWISGISNQPG